MIKEEQRLLTAKVPLSEMFGYITDLRTITSGRATSTMEFFDLLKLQKIFQMMLLKN